MSQNLQLKHQCKRMNFNTLKTHPLAKTSLISMQKQNNQSNLLEAQQANSKTLS
jgi:hypothetical protein